MGTSIIEPETILEKTGVFLDKMFDSTVKTKCEFCHKEITMFTTIFKKCKKERIKPCCSEECATTVLRHG